MSELRCMECGVKTEAKCACHKPYKYIPASEAAALGIAAHPDWSNRRIATEVGVDESTIRLLRQPSAGNPADEQPRTGRDGRRRRAGQRPRAERPRAETAPRAVRREARVADLIDRDRTPAEIAAALGVVQRHADAQIEHVRIYREGVAAGIEQAASDPSLLSMSAQRRLETATRRLETTFEARVRTQVQADLNRLLGEMAEPRLREREEDAERIVRSRTNGAFTLAEYNAILRCLHPDLNPTIEQKNEAFRLWHDRKLLLLSNADDPRTYSELPTLDELRRAYARRNV